jgi:hypothetical protein
MVPIGATITTGSTAIIDFAELSWFDLGSPDQKETD